MNWSIANRVSCFALALLIAATSALESLAQNGPYPSTGGYQQTQPRYPTTNAREPAPVVNRNPQGAPQQYNPGYTRAHLGSEQFSSGGYPATDSVGPYNDTRWQDDYRPDFHRPPPQQRPELFGPGKVVAIIGTETILAGDLYGDINQMLAPYKDKATEEQLDEQRQLLMQKMLPQMIQTKTLYQELLATLPPEALPNIQDKLAGEFDEKQLPVLMERAKVDSAAELDSKLREYGSSIDKQRRQFMEQILAREVVRQNVNSEPSVSHSEMLRYYQTNAKEYERPERVRWEELAVRFDQFNTKGEAYRAIANMGNRVLRGAAFSRIAREQSQGFSAENGGWHDWTLRDTLKYPEIDKAVFSLPTNQLSRVIETEIGFHIIRVLDFEAAGRKPFFQEQANIKAKLQKEKRDAEVDAYLTKVKSRVRVWTIFDDQDVGAE